MARTPLLSRLQQLFADFDEADRTGRSVPQVQAARKSNNGVSRRDFLKATGAAVGAMAMGVPLDRLPRPDPRIAIIGGGIAGLNAALTLSDAGIASTVYEASNRVGGRMHSDTTSWLNGQTTERCGELIDSAHKTILGLANRFNLPTVDLLAAEPNHSTDTDFFFGSYYTQTQANNDFGPVWNAVKKDLISAPFPTTYKTTGQAALDLDHLSLYQWIETRVPGGHGSSMGQLLDVAYNIEYGNVTTEQSSLNMVYLLGFQPQPGNFRIFGKSDERYHIVGGNEQLPRAIAASLPAGAVQLNTAMTGILHNSDNSFTVSFSGPSGKFSQVFDRVIIAIPFSVLRTLLPSSPSYRAAGFDTLKQTAIQQLGYGKNAKLQLQFNTRYWNGSGPWGIGNGNAYSDTGFQNTWESTRAQAGSTGIIVDYLGGGVPLASFKGNPDDPSVVAGFANTFLSQYEPLFPGITAQWNGRATLDVPLTNPFLLTKTFEEFIHLKEHWLEYKKAHNIA